MNVLIVSAVFPPEPVVSAITSGDVAKKLAEEGHHVTVIAPFPNRPAGRIYAGYRRRWVSREVSTAGYQIYHCFNILSASSSPLSRFLENVSFGLSSAWAAICMPLPDVIYSNSWPIFATGCIRLISWLKRIPLVLSIQDVFPDVLVSQGHIQESSIVYRMILGIDRLINRGCRAIIVISEPFARVYHTVHQVPVEKLTVIPNWIPADSVVVGAKETYRPERGIPLDAFVIVYGGNINLSAGVESVIQALSQVHTARPVYLVVAGAGSQLNACQELANSLPGIHVLFHSPWDDADKSKVLAAADVFILPTQGHLSSVPSKLISYLLASRPVLAVVLPESEVAAIINQVGCGWVVSPGEPAMLAAKIEALTRLPEQELEEKGKAGLEYALKNHVSEACLPKVIDVITRAAAA